MNQYHIWVEKWQSNRYRRRGLFFVLIGLLLIGGEAEAVYCNRQGSENFTADFGTVTVSSQDPIGKVLAEKKAALRTKFICVPKVGVLWWVKTQASWRWNYNAHVESNNFIMANSGIDGVRIKVITPHSSNTLRYYNSDLKQTGEWTVDYTIQLIKTAATVNTGKIRDALLWGTYVAAQDRRYTSQNILLTGIYIKNTTIQMQAATCELWSQSKNMAVPLDRVNTAELRNLKVSKKKEFVIDYKCTGNPNVKLKLSSQNTINASQGIIGLTNASHHGVAKGVGIQLLRNGKPAALNQEISLGKIDGDGWQIVKMAAQYIHTGDTIIPGTANATLTYELKYN